MLYLYDDAIVEDLKYVINPENIKNPAVTVFSGEEVAGVAAMLQNDELHFPIICLKRNDYSKDPLRCNFTWQHRGVATVMDREKNELYYERRIPIKFSYTMAVYGVNQAQMDEIVRELIFHYSDMFFLAIDLPYEDSKMIRFGVQTPVDLEVKTASGFSEYVESGSLYETDIEIEVLGAFLVEYVPVKLKRSVIHTTVE